jgi:hypothetical protein
VERAPRKEGRPPKPFIVEPGKVVVKARACGAVTHSIVRCPWGAVDGDLAPLELAPIGRMAGNWSGLPRVPRLTRSGPTSSSAGYHPLFGLHCHAQEVLAQMNPDLCGGLIV